MSDFDKIIVGDFITILRDGKFPRKIVKVEKVNKTTFRADNILFKMSGTSVQGDWHKVYCKPYEKSDSDYIRLRNKQHKINNLFNIMAKVIYEKDEGFVDSYLDFFKAELKRIEDEK